MSLGANVVWTFFRQVQWAGFEDELRNLLSADGYGSVIPAPEFVFASVLAASAICYAGMLFFRRWAVWLLLIIDVVVLVALAPFAGVEVSAPVERIARTVFLMADGAIIALALLSEARALFK